LGHLPLEIPWKKLKVTIKGSINLTPAGIARRERAGGRHRVTQRLTARELLRIVEGEQCSIAPRFVARLNWKACWGLQRLSLRGWAWIDEVGFFGHLEIIGTETQH
jgi:hypothetical protein